MRQKKKMLAGSYTTMVLAQAAKIWYGSGDPFTAAFHFFEMMGLGALVYLFMTMMFQDMQSTMQKTRVYTQRGEH